MAAVRSRTAKVRGQSQLTAPHRESRWPSMVLCQLRHRLAETLPQAQAQRVQLFGRSRTSHFRTTRGYSFPAQAAKGIEATGLARKRQSDLGRRSPPAVLASSMSSCRRTKTRRPCRTVPAPPSTQGWPSGLKTHHSEHVYEAQLLIRVAHLLKCIFVPPLPNTPSQLSPITDRRVLMRPGVFGLGRRPTASSSATDTS